LAGVVLLGTGGAIPPMSVTNMETECAVTEKKAIYPFAYRTHTHTLGKMTYSGYG
jgi:peptidylglycine monooxygenase